MVKIKKRFKNEGLPWFSTRCDLSYYSPLLPTADIVKYGIWDKLRKLMWKTDGRLVDRNDNKMQDEDAAAYLGIPLEQFKPALESLENWRLWQRDEDGVIFDPELIEQMGAIRETHDKDNARKKDKNNDSATRNPLESEGIRWNPLESEEIRSKSKSKRKKEDSSAIYKRERSKSPAPGGVDPPPVDNSTHSTHSLIYKFPKFCSYTEALAKLVETTGKTICNGIGESARRQAIESKLADIIEKGGDPVHWFATMEEAIIYAGENPQKPAGEILAKFRQYPDGIQDNGKDSRCEQLIRVVSKAKPYGACAKFLGISAPFNPNPSGIDDWDTIPASNSPANEEDNMPF